MYELKKKIGKVFTSKFVGTGPSSYEKRIYRAAVSQRLRNTGVKERSSHLLRDGNLQSGLFPPSGRMWTWQWEVLEFCINPQAIDARTVLKYKSTKYFNWIWL